MEGQEIPRIAEACGDLDESKTKETPSTKRNSLDLYKASKQGGHQPSSTNAKGDLGGDDGKEVNATTSNKRLRVEETLLDSVPETPKNTPTNYAEKDAEKGFQMDASGELIIGYKDNDDSDHQAPPTPPPSAASTITNASSVANSEGGGIATPSLEPTGRDDPPLKASVSSANNGGAWTDDEAYNRMPKTPVAPQSVSQRSAVMRQAMSPTPGASSTIFFHDLPPAPPTTPAPKSTSGGYRDLGLATPMPFTAGFVQNTNELEQRHRQNQEHHRKKREREQEFQEGAATPAPPRTQSQAEARPPAATIAATSLSDDFSEWAVGDRYQLCRMLGRGSYGEVAQAIDKYQGRPDAFVAIKRIVGPFDQEVDAVRLFREIHILRRLRTLGKNDCIVPLLDVVQPPTEDLNDFHDLYLVFDYVDTDLYKLIMSPQYLTTEHIQTFLYQMLIGLKYIHSGNVIHRDLKPANILLNEDCSLKICDFGLARIVNEASVARSSCSPSANRTRSSENHVSDTSCQGAPTEAARKRMVAAKKLAGRSCSISEQLLSHGEGEDAAASSKLPLTRQLTKHVVTRWYRAPELILIQPYTTAVDVWSLGCIFAELLSMQEGSVPSYQDRTPLFPGGACYPLSGDTDNTERLDQLNVIFNVIGTPSQNDIAQIGQANEYIKTMKPIKPKKLKDIYPAADPNALDLLQNMLKFNPKERCTAAEALKHKFFEGIRREDMETIVAAPMKSPTFLNEQEIDIGLLKQEVYNEVLWFRDKHNHSNGQTGQRQSSE